MNRCIISRLFTIIICCLCFGNVAFSQTKKELQQKKQQLQKEIEYTNKLLKETASTKNTSLNQLRKLNKKISTRENLIATMESEINLLTDSIKLQEQKVDSLEQDLIVLKNEYAEMIRSAYKNRNAYNKMMFLFASEDFNQAFKRLKYFQQYAQYRQSQAKKIISQQEQIDAQIRILEASKKSNEGLLQAKLNERSMLSKEKNEQESVVNSLKGKEQQLKKNLQEKQQAAQKITQAIERVIAEEIRKAREAAKKAGEKEEGYPMTPEARELSNSFAANKGKLPWPVNEGVITGLFGEHPHPTLSGVKVQNNGIDISTKKENMGRAVFEGKVSRVIIIPGEGKVIMINHGEYFSVYSFFKEVFVSAGDKVSTKQNLGVLIADADDSSSNLHIEIWKMKNKLNPEQWIFKK